MSKSGCAAKPVRAKVSFRRRAWTATGARAVMRKETELQGVPVMGDCKRCCGRGYERIPSTQAHEAVCGITDAISLDTWKKSVKPFYEALIGKLEIEESWANAALNRVTA